MDVSVKGNMYSARVSDNNLCSFRLRAQNAVGDERMCFRRIGADDEDAVCIFKFRDGIGHRAAAERRCQTGNR
jgi:hypothetical protein